MTGPDLGLVLAGYLARTSVLGLAGVALVAVEGWRRRPDSAASAASAGLLALLAAPFLALVPWPAAWSFGPPGGADRVATSARSFEVRVEPVDAIEFSRPFPARPAPPPGLRGPASPSPPGPASPARRTVARPTFPVEPRRPIERPIPVDRGRVEWPGWVAAGILCGWTVGFARLGLGLVGIRRRVAASRPILDPSLRALAREIAAALGCRRSVTILESDSPGLPATIGWIRPCILLPVGWEPWTEPELRVVLAHELAHVRRGDYAERLLGRVAGVVHFYHPIAHWLLGRLGLYQELAADARAIEIAGGRSRYLNTLARMALRADAGLARKGDRSVPAFDGSFLRRMEMLCNDLALGQTPERPPWRSRWASLAVLGVVAVVAMAARATRTTAADRDDPTKPAALASPEPRTAKDPAPFVLPRVPDDTVAVIAIRPSALLAHEDIQALMSLAGLNEEVKRLLDAATKLGLAPASIEQIAYLQLRTELAAIAADSRALARRSALIVRTKGPIVPADIAQAIKARWSGEKVAVGRIDERTAIIAAEAIVPYVLNAPPGPDPKLPWASAWAGVEGSEVAIAVDAGYARVTIESALMGNNSGALEWMLMTMPLAPITQGAKGISMGFNLVGDQVELVSVNQSNSLEEAETTQKTVEAIMTLAGNAARSARRSFRKIAFTEGGVELIGMVKLADLWTSQVLRQMKVERAGDSTRFTARIDSDALLILFQMFAM